MDSALRPREIQARIRAGESPEDVAGVAGVPLERVEVFAGPVLAEREHIGSLARQHPVRRRSETTSHRLLGTTVSDSVRSRGVAEDTVSWDAWKLADRRWRVRASFTSAEEEIEADFVYEQGGRFSVADNASARALIGDDGDGRAPLREVPAGDDLALVRAIQGRQRPESIDDDITPAAELNDTDEVDDAFHEGELTEVDGVYEIVAEPPSNMDILYDMLSSFDEDSVKIYSGLVHPLEDTARVVDADPGAEPDEMDSPAPPDPGLQSDEPEQLSLIDEIDPAPEVRTSRARRKRASVPSWDEIMFGSPKNSE